MWIRFLIAICAGFALGFHLSFADAVDDASGAGTQARASAGAPPAGGALPERRYAGLPATVAVEVKALEAECRAAGGAPRWSAEQLFEVVDISRDGRPDYLVRPGNMTCDEVGQPWRGSDGYRYILLVSTGPGRWVRAFDRAARDFEIMAATQPADPARIFVFSHVAHCTSPNPGNWMRCSQYYEWRGGRLQMVSEEWFTE